MNWSLLGFIVGIALHVLSAVVFAAVMIRKEPADLHDDGHCSGLNAPCRGICKGKVTR